MRSSVGLAALAALGFATCPAGCAEDRVIQPAGSSDAAPAPGTPDAFVPTGNGDGGLSSSHCDMTGRWIRAQVVFATALGAKQKTVTWYYDDITQTGDTFTITKSLNCGLRVTGTTTVTLKDSGLEALSKNSSSSVGRKGTYKLTGDGQKCQFDLDRTYDSAGIDKSRFLDNVWKVGDPPKDLSAFPPLPADAAGGMQDWDADGMEGVTLVSGLGERYVAQRSWNEHHGTTPLDSASWGGDGMISAIWDGQETVSQQTGLLLRTTATPTTGGYAFWAKVGSGLTVVDSGAHPELDTCKNVQTMALTLWPNP